MGTALAAEPPVHELWRADRTTGFDGWTLLGAQSRRWSAGDSLAEGVPADGTEIEGLTLPLTPAGPVGIAVSPVQPTTAPFRELIASWNAQTPPGSWIEVRLRAQVGGRRRLAGAGPAGTSLAPGLSNSGPEYRQSVKDQRDADGRVSTDTVAARRAIHELSAGA